MELFGSLLACVAALGWYAPQYSQVKCHYMYHIGLNRCNQYELAAGLFEVQSSVARLRHTNNS